MKALKCIFAVILGIVLGLVSSCSSKDKPEGQPGRPNEKQAPEDTGKGAQENPPKKGEDLPVRRPILE